jgi:hypothetical protein
LKGFWPPALDLGTIQCSFRENDPWLDRREIAGSAPVCEMFVPWSFTCAGGRHFVGVVDVRDLGVERVDGRTDRDRPSARSRKPTRRWRRAHPGWHTADGSRPCRRRKRCGFGLVPARSDTHLASNEYMSITLFGSHAAAPTSTPPALARWACHSSVRALLARQRAPDGGSARRWSLRFGDHLARVYYQQVDRGSG